MISTKSLHNLGHEGLRLFFVLSALHMAVWPFLWVVVQSFDLPFDTDISPSIWHAHEMLIGGFGAALLGFITTAVPEWTDTAPLRHRPLYMLASLWGAARIVGFLGWDGMIWLAGCADLAWVVALLTYLLVVSWRRQTDRLLVFAFWLATLAFCEFGARIFMILDDFERMQTFTQAIGFVFLGVLAVALGRITVPVSNLVLDPSEKTSPFRPHPGRLNLAAGLVWLAILFHLIGVSQSIQGFLWIAAGAGFLDRVAEAFVGRAFFRAEIVVLWAAAAVSGIGLLLLGCSYLGADFPSVAGLHLALMGGAGIGIIAVFTIAGLLHTERSFPFPRRTWLVLTCLGVSVGLRLGPDVDIFPHPFGLPYLLASIVWSLTFVVWLIGFFPILSSDPIE